MDDPDNVRRWQVIERAKKRLIYSLLRLRLPLATRSQDAVHGLSFPLSQRGIALEPVLTGHDDGVITIALTEADDAQREYRRTNMNEPYRTLLGHFRHEVGHHYWDILVAKRSNRWIFPAALRGRARILRSRAAATLRQGAPADWQNRPHFRLCHVTSLGGFRRDLGALSAHRRYHRDGLGLRSPPRPGGDWLADLTSAIDFDPYGLRSIDELIDNWVPLASLINNLNRAVGQHDAYPFVLTPRASLTSSASSSNWCARRADAMDRCRERRTGPDQHSGRLTLSPPSDVSL